MKILVISHMYPHRSNELFGTFVHQMNKALKKEGLEITVFSPTPMSTSWMPVKRWRDYVTKEKKSRINNIPVYYPRFISLGRLSSYFAGILGYLGIKKLSEKIDFDVIFAHTAHLDGRIAARLSKKFNKPFVVYIHGADIQKKAMRSKVEKWQIIRNLKKADKTFVNSRKILNIINDMSPDVKARVIPVGINREPVYKKKNEESVELLTVANLVPEKGLPGAIKAFLAISKELNLKYTIIGDGPLREDLQRISSNRVTFTGRMQNREVLKQMGEADIFLLPSLNEAFGIVYLESLWQKTPIIGSRGQGVEDILAKGEAGLLVNPHNTKEIKEAIKLLVKDSAKREQMGEIGHKIVENNYLWEKIAKIIHNDIKELI